jgi:hypothetical protein
VAFWAGRPHTDAGRCGHDFVKMWAPRGAGRRRGIQCGGEHGIKSKKRCAVLGPRPFPSTLQTRSVCAAHHTFQLKNNWLWMQNDQLDTFPASAMVNARPKELPCLFAFEMIKF